MAHKRSINEVTNGVQSKRSRAEEHLEEFLPNSDVYLKPWRALGAWFLGPRAENTQELRTLINSCIQWYSDCRQDFFPSDPSYITNEIKSSIAYREEISDIKEELEKMHNEMKKSVPFFTPRYKGHMTWEVTMPSMLGYFAGMLWNQNNVDASASPVTTKYEIMVGQQLCHLMGFSSANPKGMESWAHITCGGSVANIEAMWAARNLKFHPLATQAITLDADAGPLSAGQDHKVYVPKRKKYVKLKHCTSWELLNLRIDDICSLTDDMLETIVNANPSQNANKLRVQFDGMLKKHSAISIGLFDFMKAHKLENTPVICSPGTNHYSWPKGSTLLGMGDQHIREIHVDKNARQSVAKLREELDDCLKRKIPVLMVVAVIGSTEESAIDPLEEIVKLRKEYCNEKGLNFVIHADSAWGGYMLTMLQKPDQISSQKRKSRGEDYVPYFGLSDYAERQYLAIKHADTVTIDPHKTGLCQYPAGALAYRNGTMKAFITLKAPEVFHDPNDITVGVFGLEGSKPGAAACGVLLSHKVIGLDQNGYGRILGQCQFGSKLFYCMWLTVAEDYDDFICVNMIDLPEESPAFPYSHSEAKEFIKNRILGRDNVEISKDKEATSFLCQVGPDALINTFVVNLKGNIDIKACNTLQKKIFSETSTKVGESTKRTPMFLTTSMFEQERYGPALTQLKERLNLPVDDTSLGFLRNTVMNPFQSSEEFVTNIGKTFRNVVLNSIGGIKDPEDNHTFIVVNFLYKNTDHLFLDYVPCFGKKQSQYHVVIKVKLNHADVQKYRRMQEAEHRDCLFSVRTKIKHTMMELIRGKKSIEVEVFKEHEERILLLDLSINVDEVYQYQHLENTTAKDYINYPSNQSYFLYGDEHNTYMSHIMTRHPDFHQIIRLDEKPHSLPDNLVDLGLIVKIPGIEGEPLMLDGEIIDPLQATSYTIEFRGEKHIETKSSINFSKKGAKRWFDSKFLNKIQKNS